PVTFHSQQCAEKYLKALLQREDITPPRTHDLPTLLDALAATHPDLESYRPHCAFLAPFAIQSRYPGEEATAEDAREAIVRLEPLREAIRKSLGLVE
ncbi:MAG: HEPN domain-containing protein, partial [bacterium]